MISLRKCLSGQLSSPFYHEAWPFQSRAYSTRPSREEHSLALFIYTRFPGFNYFNLRVCLSVQQCRECHLFLSLLLIRVNLGYQRIQESQCDPMKKEFNENRNNASGNFKKIEASILMSSCVLCLMSDVFYLIWKGLDNQIRFD